jgi:hypothetical protein
MANQTEELWLTDALNNDVGTGVFVFPEQQTAEFGSSTWETMGIQSQVHGVLHKALVSSITYPDCVKRGERTWMLGYKWVPETVAPYGTVQAAAASCSPTRCVKRCASYGCVCIAGECK